MFYGNINPNQNLKIEDDHYQTCLNVFSQNEKKLMDSLSDPDIELLLDLLDADSIILGTTAVEQFKYGFKLGLLFGIEVAKGQEEYLTDKI